MLLRVSLTKEDIGVPLKTLRPINITNYDLPGEKIYLSPSTLREELVAPRSLPRRLKLEITPEPVDNIIRVYKYTYKAGKKTKSAPLIIALLNKLAFVKEGRSHYPVIYGLADDEVYDIMQKVERALKIVPSSCKTVHIKFHARELRANGLSVNNIYEALPQLIEDVLKPYLRDALDNPGGAMAFVYATEYSPAMGVGWLAVTCCPIPINVAKDKERIEKVLGKLAKKLNPRYKGMVKEEKTKTAKETKKAEKKPEKKPEKKQKTKKEEQAPSGRTPITLLQSWRVPVI